MKPAVTQRSPQTEIIFSKERIKECFIKILSNTIQDTQDRGVIIAFTLGDKEYLSYEIKKAYQISGAIHVLALSGLHIGIIYNLFNFLLFFLNFHYISKYIKLCLCAICITLYAAFTGFSPSVQRAAIMIITWKALSLSGRKSGKWDVLLLSACIIILINPNEIENIGFQLSYAATAGIIAIYPTVNTTLDILGNHTAYKYLKPVWSMVAITIACQISTFPLVLYYFGKIPFYFLLTNLIAIPLVTITLYTTIISLLTSTIPIIGNISEILLQKSIHLLNSLIKYIGEAV